MSSANQLALASAPIGTVVCINSVTAHSYGNVLERQYRLRYETFVIRRRWDGVSVYKGMEYDEYDTPAAQYLVRLAEGKAVHGSVRVSPTDRSYMLKDKWPEMCAYRPLPASISIWEITRLCVDQSLEGDLRRQVKNNLVCALLEFGLANDIREFIGVLHPKHWRSVFEAAGWKPQFMGSEKFLGDGPARAGVLPVNSLLLETVRNILGIDHSVLDTGDDVGE